jgi:hypothetical protein
MKEKGRQDKEGSMKRFSASLAVIALCPARLPVRNDSQDLA